MTNTIYKKVLKKKHTEVEFKIQMLLQLHMLATKWLFKTITQYIAEH